VFRSAADIEGSPVIRWICRGSRVCAVTSWHRDHARKAIAAALTDRPRGRPLPPAPWVAHQNLASFSGRAARRHPVMAVTRPRTKIKSSDPPLTAVGTAYATLWLAA
jgi:hypothetical protein